MPPRRRRPEVVHMSPEKRSRNTPKLGQVGRTTLGDAKPYDLISDSTQLKYEYDTVHHFSC